MGETPRQLELFPEPPPTAPQKQHFWSYHCPACPFAEVRVTPPPQRCPMCGQKLAPPAVAQGEAVPGPALAPVP